MASPGVNSWANYGWEAAGYATEATTQDKVFGHGVRISTLSRRNNTEPSFTIGKRNAQKLPDGKYEGLCTVEFDMANPWFWQGVMGTVSSTTTSPYTHTFAEADTIPSMTIDNNVSTDTDSVAALLGVKINSATLSTEIGGNAAVRLDCIYANETHGTTTTAQVTESMELYTFAHGSFELPDATTLAYIQNIEVGITNNAEVIHGIGSRVGQACTVKNRDYTGRASLNFSDSSQTLQAFYGSATGPATSPAETASMQLTFTNGLTGTNTRNVILTYTGVKIDEESLPQDPKSNIIEDINLVARALSVTAVNATGTAL